jgi:hypothetical protein
MPICPCAHMPCCSAALLPCFPSLCLSVSLSLCLSSRTCCSLSLHPPYVFYVFLTQSRTTTPSTPSATPMSHRSCPISSHPISSHLIPSLLISPHITSYHLIPPHLISPHITSYHPIPSLLISPHPISSPHLFSYHLRSVLPQQSGQPDPRASRMPLPGTYRCLLILFSYALSILLSFNTFLLLYFCL